MRRRISGAGMVEFFSQTSVQAVLGVAVLLAVVIVGFHVVLFLRPSTTKDHTSASDLARNFEEMRFGGDISDAEFRTIKSVLEKKQADSIGYNG